MSFRRCANEKCHNTTARMSSYCSYCKCLVFTCNNIVGEYNYCQKHKCTETLCLHSTQCNGKHLYNKYSPWGKCLICTKVGCENTPYCNEHGCLRFTENGKRHNGYINYKYCKNVAKVKNGKLFECCNDCLIYCNEPLCTSEHKYGSNYCQRHDYQNFYYRTIESKNNFRCGSSLCKKCPVFRDFIYLYFMVALSCDARVPYAIMNTTYKNINSSNIQKGMINPKDMIGDDGAKCDKVIMDPKGEKIMIDPKSEKSMMENKGDKGDIDMKRSNGEKGMIGLKGEKGMIGPKGDSLNNK